MNPSNKGRIVRTGIVAVALVAIVAILQGMSWLPDWTNPFGDKEKDRSGPVLLQSIRDLSRYEAATGQFQVVVDLEKDAKFLPSSIRGNRTLFVANGTVDAYVDFSKLDKDAVTTNADRTEVTVRLPRAELEETNLDEEKSYVFATQRGLFDRVGDLFSGNPNDQQQLYVLGAKKIQEAAGGAGLRERADANTKTMLEGMFKSLGFTKVTIVQPQP